MSEEDFEKIFSQWEQNHKITNKDEENLNHSYKKDKHNNKNKTPTIDLHGLTKEQAIRELRKFVMLNRGKKVTIIHGAGLHSQGGKAILKDAVREWLTGHPDLVKRFRPASIGEGRHGATIAYLR